MLGILAPIPGSLWVVRYPVAPIPGSLWVVRYPVASIPGSLWVVRYPSSSKPAAQARECVSFFSIARWPRGG